MESSPTEQGARRRFRSISHNPRLMGGGTPVDVTPAAASPTFSSGGDSATGADPRTQALAALDGTISRARHPSGLVPPSSAQRGVTPSSVTSGGDGSGSGGGRRLRQASGPTTVANTAWGTDNDRAAGQADRRPRQPSRQSMVASVIGGAAPSIGGTAVARTRLASGRSVRSGFSAVGGGPALRADPADPIYKVTSEDTPESLAKKVHAAGVGERQGGWERGRAGARVGVGGVKGSA